MSVRSHRRLGSSATIAVLAFIASSFAVPACTATDASSPAEATSASSQELTADGGADATLDATVTPQCRHLDVSASVVYDNDNTDPAAAHTDWNDDVHYFASPFAFAIPAALPVTSGNPGDDHAVLDLTRSDGTRTQCVYTSGRATPAGHLVVSTRQASAGNIALGNRGMASFRLVNAGGSAITITRSTPPSGGAFSATSAIAAGTVIAPGASVSAQAAFTPTSTGILNDTWTFTTSEGANVAIALVGAGVQAAVVSPVAGGWQLNGDAVLVGGADSGTGATTLQLTNAIVRTPGAAGSSFWPTPVASQHLAVSFDARMHDGLYGADGLTLTLADPSSASPTSLGDPGAGLGFGGLNGVAIALDSYWYTSDLPSNFVGVTDGTLNQFRDLQWLATATNIPSLRVAPRHVTVTVEGGLLRVALDGLEVIRTTVLIPPNVLVGFTGGTGASTDLHDVSNVSISTDAPAASADGTMPGASYVFASCDDGSAPGVVVPVVALRTSLAAASGNTAVGFSLDERGGGCDAGAPDASADGKADASACVTSSIVAVQSYVPGASSDVTNRIVSRGVKFAIPASVPILAGSSAHTEAWLAYWTGNDPSTAMTCHYAVNTATLPFPADGTARWIDCGGKKTPKPGALIKADHFAAGVTVSEGVPFAVVDFELPDQRTCGAPDAGADASIDAADASADAADATVRDAADASDTGVRDATDAADTSVRDAADSSVPDAADANVHDATDSSVPDAADSAPACTAQQCDDGNPCTADSCAPGGGCAHTAATNGTTCNDGNACTQSDTCQSGTCTGASPVTCTASDQCHVAGTCSPSTGQCSNPTAADGASCSDGNACTTSDTCQAGVCSGRNPVACSASDQCHVAGTCDPASGACSNPIASNGTTCNDSSACTQIDSCQSGACVGASPVVCTGSDQCHAAGTCDPASGACSNPIAANGTTCTDGNACTTGDVCQSGSCAGAPVVCAAQDACHAAGSCNAATGVCSNPPSAAGTACGNNSNACVGALLCNGSGACVQGPPPAIDTSNPCVVGSCDPATGVHYAPAPSGTACADNSNKCIGAYACNGSGACGQGAPPKVDDGNPCTTDSCDASAGVTHTPTPGAACGDNSNKCATTYVCDASAMCQTIPAPVVSPKDRCTTGACDPSTGTVSYAPIAGCDPNPTTGGTFEPQASLLGALVVSGTGAPATGFSITAFDDVVSSTPRTDVSLSQASDGSFRARLTSFPTSEPDRSPPHHVILRFDAPNYLPVFRDAYLHPGIAVDLGSINVVPRDSVVTTIDAAGGKAIDSQGLVEVDIPAGALAGPTPIRITAFRSRDDLPYVLPDATMAGMAMTMEPNGLQFQTPVTVRLTNWRNMPTSLQVPVGVLDEKRLVWNHQTFAVWDGKNFVFTTPHFSTYDANDPELGVMIASFARGHNKTNSAQQCGGSTFGLANGTMRQSFTLPGVKRKGQSYDVGINYDAMLTYGVDETAPPASGGKAVSHVSNVIAAGSGVSMQFNCVAKGQAEKILNSSPGTCSAGPCTTGSVVPILPGLHMKRVTAGSDESNVDIDPSGNSIQFDTDIPVALPLTDQNDLSGPGYLLSNYQLRQKGTMCAGGGAAFGEASVGGTSTPAAYDPGPANPTPLATLAMPTFVYHRHTTPYGIGWGINGMGHVYKNPSADEAVLVSGDGNEEFFYPRARASASTSHTREQRAYALDRTTGEVFRAARSTNSIDKMNTVDNTSTTLLSGLALDTAPQMMTIGYIGGVRHFILAMESRLLDIDAGGHQRTLTTRSVPKVGSFFLYASAVTVVGEYAYYTAGNIASPVLVRFHLTDATPAPESISLATGGDISLNPTGTAGAYTFGDIHGLAPAIDGGLYVSDRRRNTVFELKPDPLGQVSALSPVTRVVGDGAGHFVAPIGIRSPGLTFGIASPGYLFTGSDGVLWMFTAYGAATYDPVSSEARWLIYDVGVPNNENMFSFYNQDTVFPAGSFIPISPTSVYGDDNQNAFRVDVDLYSSETDPTRTLAFVNGAATLTDTTQDILESYDAGGRLLQRQTRGGDPVFAVTYVSPISDTIAAVIDPLGGASTFAYSGGRLQSITDAAGRTTSFGIDANADLTSFTEADGETWRFTYQNHHMTTKTSPEGDVTTYSYAADGTLHTITKPAGETFTINPGYSKPPSHDAAGNSTYSSSYIDPHGVTHNVTVDERGRPLTDQYTADGVSYTVQHDRVTTLGDQEAATSWRSNRLLGRDRRVRVNNLIVGNDNTYDDLGRWHTDVFVGADGITGTQDSVAYSADGRVAAVFSGPAADRFDITRDASGRPTRIAESTDGRAVDYTWNPNGTVATSTAHGVTTTYVYDPLTLNVLSTTDTIGRTTAFTYDAAGNVLTANDGTTTWTFAHDAVNRLTAATDADGNATTLGYVQMSCGCSQANLLTTLHTPDLQATQAWQLAYGAEGRLASLTDPEGRAETYAYEVTGELKSLVDRNHHSTAITHDHLGRVQSIVDAIGRAHARAYTTPTNGAFVGQDVLSGSSGAGAASTDFTQPLNPGDYQLGTNSYDIGSDANGHHTRGWASVEFYRDATFQLSYGRTIDDAGRTGRVMDRPSAQLTSTAPQPTGSGLIANVLTSYPNSLPIPLVTAQQSPAPGGTQGTSFQYNAEYDLTYMFSGYEGGNSQSTYTLDVAGRVKNVLTTRFGSAAAQLNVNQAYTYLPTGQLQSSPQGTYTYDERGLVKTRAVASGTYTYGYDVLGRNNALTYPDGHERLQQYDAEGRITSRCYTYSNGAANRCYTATYDAVGNPLQMVDPEGMDTIEYDALDRVKRVTRTSSGHADVVESYDYNALGALKVNAGAAIDDQRPKLSGSGTADSAIPNSFAGQPVTIDGEGKITSLAGTAIGYNPHGAVSSIAGATLHHDAFMRVAADDSAGVVYTYDGANRSTVWQYQGTKWVQHGFWLYDGVDHPLEHVDDAGNRQYYELDLAGNVRRLRAAAGADLGGYRYTAFGADTHDAGVPAPVGVNALPVRWKGRWLAYAGNGVELYDMRARVWWPQGGVFLSVDDFNYSDISMTLWAWPGQNPFRWSDPSGHDFWSAAGAFGEGVAWGLGGSVVVAGLVATGTVVGAVAAVGLVGYGAFELGASLMEAALGHDMAGNPISDSDRVDIAAGAAGGLLGGALGGEGLASGREFEVPLDSCRGPTGKPARVAPWGNRTGNRAGERPHYHRAIPDPAKPGNSMPGQGMKNHRPWEGGW